MDELIRNEIIKLVGNSNNTFVSSVDKDGHPNTKAMFALKHDGLATHYFSTNLSAKRTQQFLSDPHACIYFCNESEFKGLMLIGEMQVCTDREHKVMLWKEGYEIYYPKGIDDEDYCVLKFTAQKGNYYHGLENNTFVVEDF
jgi:general stress protein 26